MVRRLVNVAEEAERHIFRDVPCKTVHRHWMCGEDGCDGEMRYFGRAIGGMTGGSSQWGHRCNKCGREEWASCTYPRFANIPDEE